MSTSALRRWLGPAVLSPFLSLLPAESAPAAEAAGVAAAQVPTTVVVRAIDQTPTRTGVRVRRGQRLLIEARGTWCLGGTPPTAECGGPQGIRPADPVELPLVLDGARIGTLIGRIGDGPWFVVGRQRRITAQREGRLVLLFNDRPCCYGDNSRSVRVAIRRP
jgi:PA-IL-like protein